MTVATKTWTAVCSEQDLVPYSGIAAKVHGKQIALFYIPHLTPALYAISNYDPFSEANVIARGLVGDSGGELCVVSPLYKQRFSLAGGQCLEDASITLDVWECRMTEQKVELCLK